MKKTLVAIFSFVTLATFADDASVCHVAARQRWPFSRVVDIDIVLDGAKCCDSELFATYDGSLAPLSLLSGLTDGSPTLVPGINHLVWDPQAAGLGESELKGFSVAAALSSFDSRKYLVIDLKERTWAYHADDPDGTGWTDDKYKLRYIVFRRIPAGVYQLGYSEEQRARWKALGAGNSEPNSALRTVAITRDYYLSIYMLTGGQSAALDWHSTTGNGGVNGYYYADKWVTEKKPHGGVTTDWRGGFNNRATGCTWPQDGHAVVMPSDGVGGSVVGKFRQLMKNGNNNLPPNMIIDLPTEAQWEVAARAGTTTFYDGCGTLTDDAATITAYQCAHSTNQNVSVGLMLPNSWGMYDMSGIRYEMTLNTVAGVSAGSYSNTIQCWVEGQTVDPVGVTVADGEQPCAVCCNCGFTGRSILWGALPSGRRAYSATSTEKVASRLAIHLGPLVK